MRIYLAFLMLFSTSYLKAQYADSIPLNDIRILASHNSYKLKPNPKVSKFLTKFKKQLGEENDPIQLEYSHLPLKEQLDSFNIRGFELDVYYDPEGGRYKKRKVNGFIRGLKKRSKNPLLEQPGFKIIHISDVDYESNYTLFTEALLEIKQWSLMNPNHTPLFINIEAKGSGLGDEAGILRFMGFKKALKYDSIAYGALDEEIRSIFNEDQLFTQKNLRAGFPNVKDRLDSLGWPTIGETKGKVVFILEGSNSDVYRTFLNRNDDRAMFAYGRPGESSTAFVVRNQPIGNETEIDSLTNKYIVRTRSDAGTLEARDNDYTRYDSAIRSNAQIISTDYYRSDPEISNFFIKMPKEYMLRRD